MRASVLSSSPGMEEKRLSVDRRSTLYKNIRLHRYDERSQPLENRRIVYIEVVGVLLQGRDVYYGKKVEIRMEHLHI